MSAQDIEFYVSAVLLAGFLGPGLYLTLMWIFVWHHQERP